MTVHTPHRDSHVHGLADDCERCAEHAANPILSLDQRNLAGLMRLAVEDGDTRSHNEAVAVANVLTALERAGKLAQADRELFADYLRRWGVIVEVIA